MAEAGLPLAKPLRWGSTAALTLAWWATAGAAHATGGITCGSRDGRTVVEVTASLSDAAAGSGIVSLALTRSGVRSDAAIHSSRADYRRHSLDIAARDPVPSRPPLHLQVRQHSGRLRQGATVLRLACDWGEFS